MIFLAVDFLFNSVYSTRGEFLPIQYASSPIREQQVTPNTNGAAIAPVGISFLVGWYCSFQGSQMGKTVGIFPSSPPCVVGTMKASQERRSFQFTSRCKHPYSFSEIICSVHKGQGCHRLEIKFFSDMLVFGSPGLMPKTPLKVEYCLPKQALVKYRPTMNIQQQSNNNHCKEERKSDSTVYTKILLWSLCPLR